MKKISFCFLVILFVSVCSSAMAWLDQTHIAVGVVAQFDQAYNLAAPDVAKLKADNVEAYNHWVNNLETNTISPELIKEQIQKYNLGIESEKTGHLYGAIVAAIRAYREESAACKFATYHLVYAGHYIGDLSMPFHNMDHNKFNIDNHLRNERIIEKEITTNLDKVKLFRITIKNEDDLIQSIKCIAIKSKELGYRLQKEDRDMTTEEAYQQLLQSASLFKAVLKYVGYPKNP